MKMHYSGQGSIGVASYGALGHVPPPEFQLVILGITRFTDSDESCARFSVQ